MARQSKKNKNELDVILEQLKKSYASEASNSLEDDLLENPTDEDDAELNEILGKIFTYEDAYITPKPEESAQDNASEVSDSADNAEESSPSVESEEDAVVEAENASAEEIECNEDHMAEEVVEEDASLTVEEEAISEDVVDEDNEVVSEEAPKNSDIDAVDNVLNLMFSRKDDNVHSEENHTAIASIIDAPSIDEKNGEIIDESADDVIIEPESAETVCEEDIEIDTEEDTELICSVEADNDVDADDIECDIDEYEDVQDVESALFDDEEIEDASDDPVFAVEDEEYSVNEEHNDTADAVETEPLVDETNEEKAFVPYPVPQIVLTASRYTDDPLQNDLPTLEAIPELAYLRDLQKDISKETIQKRDKAREESFDENDISLLLKFGYHDEIKSNVGEKKTKEVLLEADNTFVPDPTKKIFGYCDKELKSRKQISEIQEKYKTGQRNLIILISVVSTLALFLLYINLSFEFFSDKVTSFPIFLLFDLILVLTLCGVLYKKIVSGFNKLMKLGTSGNTLFFIVAAAYVLYALSSFIAYAIVGVNSNPSDLMLFGFCVAFYAVLSLVSDLFNCIRERRAFDIIASSNVFYTAEKVENQRRNEKREETSAYRIRKTELISGYFRKTSYNEDLGIKPLYLIGVAPIIALISGVTVFFLSRSFALSASIAMIAIILCVPAPYLFTSSLIRFILSIFKVDRNTAFIGNPAPEQMMKARELIFDDVEAVEVVEITEIHPGGRTDTDEALEIAQGIFHSLGGTLSLVGATPAEDIGKHEVSINQISDTGIDMYYDSSVNVLIGDKQYMQRHNIKVKTDTNLHAATKGSNRSVIYMAFDGIPKLGFIVNSKIKADFLSAAERLTKSGVQVSIRSYEPHVNNLYFDQNKGSTILAANVKKSDEYEESGPIDICDGCVISSSGAIGIANAVLESSHIAKRCRFNNSLNVMIIALNILLSVAMALFVLADHSSISLLAWLRSHVEPVFFGLVLGGFIPVAIEIIHIFRKK